MNGKKWLETPIDWEQKYNDLKGLLQNCTAQGGIKKRLLLDNLGKQELSKARIRAAIAQALGVELMKAGAIRFMEDQIEINLDYIITADVIVIRDREKLKEICDEQDEQGQGPEG